MKKIKINDITLREIFQNTDLRNINMESFDMILNHINDLKYNSLEILGGSSFEKILESNLNLSPLGLATHIKSKVPSIPIQILIGARNLCGLEVYSDNIIKRFIKQCTASGISIFRVYDSLNDLNNLKYTVSTIVENGAACQGTIIYDRLQDTGFYIKNAKELKKYGCSSICIKDVESTMLPKKAGELFRELSGAIDIPKFFCTSNLRGLQILNYFEACRNGCSGIDLSFFPSSYTGCNHTVFSHILSLKDTDISHNLDYSKLIQLDDIIKRHIYPFIRQDLFPTNFIHSSIDKNLLPKWLISSIGNQLAEIGEIDAMDSVLEEVFKIKKEIGNPTLATPAGQIIGSQAILNAVISDSRWEILCDEIKKLIWGYFGKLPGKIDKKIIEKLEDESGSDKAKINLEVEEIYQQCRNELVNFSDKEEDILSYCFYPEKTRKFLEKKKAGLKKAGSIKDSGIYIENYASGKYTSGSAAKLGGLDIKKLREITSLVESSNIEEIKLEVDGVKISINNPGYRPEEKGAVKEKKPEPDTEKPENLVEVKSPIVGIFYSSSSPGSSPFVKIGDRVKEGDTLCIIEAMKLMNKINSECSGQVIDIIASNEEAVEFGQTLMVIKKDDNQSDV
jgi:oxaloacetate decarboxylase (Na+ extruding) subunit alpha